MKHSLAQQCLLAVSIFGCRRRGYWEEAAPSNAGSGSNQPIFTGHYCQRGFIGSGFSQDLCGWDGRGICIFASVGPVSRLGSELAATAANGRQESTFRGRWQGVRLFSTCHPTRGSGITLCV